MDNDYGENKDYYTHNDYLRITGEDEYNRTAQEYLNNKKYFPGKYIIKLLLNKVQIIRREKRMNKHPRRIAF